jgi:predicted glycogen debranching enzyme
MDEDDALLAAGVPGVQLTWMDAKVDGQAVTPRSGKAVEINALWYNALRLMDNWARRLGQKPSHYRELARLANESFNQKFWYAEGSYLYDVVEGDGDDGDDATLRPNQVLAIALAHPTLDPRRWDAVLDQVDKHLLTPFGLRTRAPGTPGYLGRYGGDQRQRDTAYHQGTVWPWLIGPYAEACRRAGRDLGPVRATLANLLRSAQSGGLGTIGEVFDGDLPHQPGGAIAQAWSVAEVLRGWRRVNQD